MDASITAQITVCKEILTNYNDGTHDLNKVLSQYEVPVYPSVVLINVLAKVLYRGNIDYACHLQVKNMNKVIFRTKELNLYQPDNDYRHLNNIIEDVRFVVTHPGAYYIQFVMNEQLITETPIFIRSSNSENN